MISMKNFHTPKENKSNLKRLGGESQKRFKSREYFDIDVPNSTHILIYSHNIEHC